MGLWRLSALRASDCLSSLFGALSLRRPPLTRSPTPCPAQPPKQPDYRDIAMMLAAGVHLGTYSGRARDPKAAEFEGSGEGGRRRSGGGGGSPLQPRSLVLDPPDAPPRSSSAGQSRSRTRRRRITSLLAIGAPSAIAGGGAGQQRAAAAGSAAAAAVGGGRRVAAAAPAAAEAASPLALSLCPPPSTGAPLLPSCADARSLRRPIRAAVSRRRLRS